MQLAKSMVSSSQPVALEWCQTQDAAVRISEAHPHYFIFAKDRVPSKVANSKKYTACTLPRIHKYITTMQPEYRNVYEVLRPGVPSKLYLDCDVKLSQDSDFRPEVFSSVLEPDLRMFLSSEVHPDFDDSRVTEFAFYDSSSTTKWSQHLVVNGAMFLNNYHVGAIVRRFRDYVIKKYGHPDQVFAKNPYFIAPKNTAVSTDGVRREFVIDLTVYTRYRVFRLPGNCKHGRTAFLVPAQPGVTLQETTALQRQFRLSLEELQRGLIQDPMEAVKCKIHAVKENDGSLPDSYSVHRNYGGFARRARAARSCHTFAAGELSIQSQTRARKTFCNYKLMLLLAQMIEKCEKQEVVHRSARYLPDILTVTLPVRGRRCAVRGGIHTNANVYYNVNLINRTYTQHCFSSRCESLARYKPDGTGGRPTKQIPDIYLDKIDGFLNATNSTAQASNLSATKLSGGLAEFVAAHELQIEHCDPQMYWKLTEEPSSADEEAEDSASNEMLLD